MSRRLALLAALPLLAAPGPWEPVKIGTYLTNPSRDGVTISWETLAPSTAKVEYGTSPGSLDQVVEVADLVNFHQIELDGLEPNTTYYYKASSYDASGELVYITGAMALPFETAPNRPTPYRFAFLGNVRAESGSLNGQVLSQDAFAGAITDWDTDLVLHAGSHVADGDAPEDWRQFFQELDEVFESTPIMNTFAARDLSDGTDPMSELATQLFAHPNNGRYYRFEFGNTLFVALDVDWPYDGRDPSALQWLDYTLQEANDGVVDPQYVVVYLHNTAYNATCSPDPQAGWIQENLVPMFEDHDVSLVLSASEGLYSRAEKDGVVYAQVSSSSHLDAPGCEDEHVVEARRAPSILRANVTCDALTVSAHIIEGAPLPGNGWAAGNDRVHESFTIAPREGTACSYDVDEDGVPEHLDCDDLDDRVSPELDEHCTDGLDNDCDGQIDDDDPDCVEEPVDTDDTDDTDPPAEDTGGDHVEDTGDVFIDDGAGCGCSSGGAPVGLGLALLPLVALVRRRR